MHCLTGCMSKRTSQGARPVTIKVKAVHKSTVAEVNVEVRKVCQNVQDEGERLRVETHQNTLIEGEEALASAMVHV